MLPLWIFSARVTTVYMFVADKFVVEGDSVRVLLTEICPVCLINVVNEK